MAYLKSLERLKNLPEKDRQLAAGSYVYYKGPGHPPECGCVAGKLLPTLYKNVIHWDSPGGDTLDSWVYTSGFVDAVLRRSSTSVTEGIVKDMTELELTVPELTILQHLNDDFRDGCNAEDDRRDRYHKLVWFLKVAADEGLCIEDAYHKYGWW